MATGDFIQVAITGASGLLGRAVRREFEKHTKFSVIPLGHSRDIQGGLKIDLRDGNAIRDFYEKFRPDVIIHCAAERRPDVVQSDPDAAARLNVDSASALAALKPRVFIHISTDYVFNGKNAPYAEDAPTDPLNAYGIQKAAGEEAVMEVNPSSFILRVPVLYGEGQTDESAVNVLAGIVKSDENVVMDDYQLRFPTFVGDVSRVLHEITEKSLAKAIDSGIYHFSAKEQFTKYKICEIFAKILNRSMLHIKALSGPDSMSLTNRPYNTALRTLKLEKADVDITHVNFENWWNAYLKSR